VSWIAGHPSEMMVRGVDFGHPGGGIRPAAP
jgi:hypothetical protein